jgi:hypothetical protein
VIETVDQRLTNWADEVVGARIALLGWPPAAGRDRGVGLYLLDVVPTPPPRGLKRPHIDVFLRYLVTAWAEKPEEAHRLLGQLLFAALENPEFEVEHTSLPVAAWSAFGIPPRPSFVVKLPLRKELPARPAKLVRRPVVVEVSQTASLHGVVTGPDDVPVPGALVEVPAVRLATRTDTRGRFRFARVPGNGAGVRLRVTAKGRQQIVDTGNSRREDPFVIRFSMEE